MWLFVRILPRVELSNDSQAKIVRSLNGSVDYSSDPSVPTRGCSPKLPRKHPLLPPDLRVHIPSLDPVQTPAHQVVGGFGRLLSEIQSQLGILGNQSGKTGRRDSQESGNLRVRQSSPGQLESLASFRLSEAPATQNDGDDLRRPLNRNRLKNAFRLTHPSHP